MAIEKDSLQWAGQKGECVLCGGNAEWMWLIHTQNNTAEPDRVPRGKRWQIFRCHGLCSGEYLVDVDRMHSEHLSTYMGTFREMVRTSNDESKIWLFSSKDAGPDKSPERSERLKSKAEVRKLLPPL